MWLLTVAVLGCTGLRRGTILGRTGGGSWLAISGLRCLAGVRSGWLSVSGRLPGLGCAVRVLGLAALGAGLRRAWLLPGLGWAVRILRLPRRRGRRIGGCIHCFFSPFHKSAFTNLPQF